MAARPSLLKMRVAFAKVNRDVSEAGTIIGGKVNHNTNVLTPEQGRFEMLVRYVCHMHLTVQVSKFPT